MATLREIAKDNIVEAAEGICWIALWKSGRTWDAELFWVEYDERARCFMIDEDDQQRVREILSDDYDAVFVNGYYDNLGPMEDMTISSLTDGLRFQYTVKGSLLRDCI
jgi:hypothetical protein